MLLPSPCLVNYCCVLDVKIKPIIIIIKKIMKTSLLM